MWWSLRPLVEAIDRLTAKVRRQSMWLRQPRLVVRVLRQEKNMLVYAVTAGLPVDGDVVERRLTIEVAGAEPEQRTYNGTDTDLGEVRVEQDATVTLSLVDVDDAGNVSEPAVVTFQANDTIPPSQPGQFGVALVREEF